MFKEGIMQTDIYNSAVRWKSWLGWQWLVKLYEAFYSFCYLSIIILESK